MEKLILENTQQLDIEALMGRFRGPLIGLLASWGVPFRDAQELAQEVFVQAYLSQQNLRSSHDEHEKLGAWLRGIARNLYREFVRKWASRIKQESLDSDPIDPSTTRSPETASPILTAIQKMSEEHRTVLCMHYLEENKIKEVAVLLGVSVKTVEGRLYQARKELKRRLRNDPENPRRSEVSS